MNTVRSARRILMGVVLALPLAGCGGASDPFERSSVEGTVNLDGEPLKFGEIFFKGEVDKQTDQTAQTFLPVRDGKFSSRDGTPPGKGENQVSITVYDSDPNPADDESAPEAKVLGTWGGKATVGGAEPLVFDLKAAELSKAQ